ncbi:(H+)-ATPase G subunit [Gammaproteobacteria bacterium]
MEAILKRLLDAEVKAQHLVDQADGERELIIREALADAQAANERFTARIPELQSSFIDKAQERATQAVGEMRRRYEERLAMLKQLAEERREEAIEAAVAVVLDPSQV